MHLRVLGVIAAAALVVAAPIFSEPATIALWSFDKDDAGVNDVAGSPPGRVERAKAIEGREGKALEFQDWSVVDYLKPDPGKATRVVVPHDDRLNPAAPFTITAWIYPASRPIYYGGIIEKGQGFGSSYRILLLRDMKVEGSLGAGHHAVRSPAPIEMDKWTQVSLVVDSSSLVLQLNGAEVARQPLPPDTRPASTAPVVIGERFSGRIDQVSIEKR